MDYSSYLSSLSGSDELAEIKTELQNKAQEELQKKVEKITGAVSPLSVIGTVLVAKNAPELVAAALKNILGKSSEEAGEETGEEAGTELTDFGATTAASGTFAFGSQALTDVGEGLENTISGTDAGMITTTLPTTVADAETGAISGAEIGAETGAEAGAEAAADAVGASLLGTGVGAGIGALLIGATTLIDVFEGKKKAKPVNVPVLQPASNLGFAG